MPKELTYNVPETDEQEAALEKALATRQSQKFENIVAFFSSPEVQAVLDDAKALLDAKPPKGSNSEVNLTNFLAFMPAALQGAQADLTLANQRAGIEPVNVAMAPPPLVPAAS